MSPASFPSSLNYLAISRVFWVEILKHCLLLTLNVSNFVPFLRWKACGSKRSALTHQVVTPHVFLAALCVVLQDPLAGRSIFSGSLFQYLEESRKWRNRFISVPNSYTISFYESKTVRLPPPGSTEPAALWSCGSQSGFWQRLCSLISGPRARPPPQRDYQLRGIQGLDLHWGIYGVDGRQLAR